MNAPLLEFDDFKLHFDTFDGCYQALDGVTLSVAPGEAGDRGRDRLRQVGHGQEACSDWCPARRRLAGGDLRYRGRSLLGLDEAAMRRIRGVEIAMIFQDPMTYLNPLFTIGDQMSAVIAAHDAGKPRGQRRDARSAAPMPPRCWPACTCPIPTRN